MGGTYSKLRNLSKSQSSTPKKEGKEKTGTEPSNHETKGGTTEPSNHETTVSSYDDTTIELVRKAVKPFGKEQATQRWTVAEKEAVREIVRAYQDQNIVTSENQISRIGINFLVDDYKQNGKNSLVAKVILALNE